MIIGNHGFDLLSKVGIEIEISCILAHSLIKERYACGLSYYIILLPSPIIPHPALQGDLGELGAWFVHPWNSAKPIIGPSEDPGDTPLL